MAFAQATRTWVSGVGDDANPCSRTAPGKTFAGAISKTAAGGEINVIDPGGYGAVTITKAITIDGSGGPTAGITAAGTNAIIINAGAADVVNIRHLDINGFASGLSGIRILQAAEVNIENCVIYGFTVAGVSIDTTGNANPVRVNIKNCIIRNCTPGGAVLSKPGSGGAVVNIGKCSLNSSQYGFRAEDGTRAIVDDCVVASNVNNGVLSFAGVGATKVSVSRCAINDVTGSGGGVAVAGAGAVVRISDCTIFNNIRGVFVSSGNAFSAGNNRIRDNTTDVSGVLQSAGQQ